MIIQYNNTNVEQSSDPKSPRENGTPRGLASPPPPEPAATKRSFFSSLMGSSNTYQETKLSVQEPLVRSSEQPETKHLDTPWRTINVIRDDNLWLPDEWWELAKSALIPPSSSTVSLFDLTLLE